MDGLKITLLLFVTFIVKDAYADSFNKNWNYNRNSSFGPWNWKNHSSKCAGNRQSPINIEVESVKDNDDLGPLTLGNYHDTMEDLVFKLSNHGHATNIELKRFNKAINSPVTIIYRGVSWRFVQFHFHFGSNDDQGSEHTIDGKAYPAEMHMIHYNTKYTSVEDAKKHEDGLLVWGNLFEVNSHPNTQLNKIIKHFKDVKFEGSVFNITSFPTIHLIPNGSASSYYTYLGSLTTPTCDESVRWIINTKTIKITTVQMMEFRKLRQGHNATHSAFMYNNYRPVQPINGRIVQRYQNNNGIIFNCSVISWIIPLLFFIVDNL